MTRQLGRFYFSKCRLCDALFINDRQGAELHLCERCRAPSVRIVPAATARTVRHDGYRVEFRGHCPIAPRIRTAGMPIA